MILAIRATPQRAGGPTKREIRSCDVDLFKSDGWQVVTVKNAEEAESYPLPPAAPIESPVVEPVSVVTPEPEPQQAAPIVEPQPVAVPPPRTESTPSHQGRKKWHKHSR